MLNIESNFSSENVLINKNNMLLITSPFINFEVRSLLSLDVSILGNINLYISNIGMYLTIGFLIVLILNILVANNKLVYYY